MNDALKKTGIGQSFKSLVLGDGVSVNDLRDRQNNGRMLSAEQARALHNFDEYRIKMLNRQQTEEAYHALYMELQSMANLSPYQDFLKEDLA